MENFDIPYFLRYMIFFFCAVLFSFLINRLFLKFSKTFGIRNLDETLIRWGPQTKPSLGGIAFYIMFLFSFSVLALFSTPGEEFLTNELIGLLLAISLGVIVGLADDAYNTNPL